MTKKGRLTEEEFVKVKKYLKDVRKFTTKEVAEICGVSVTSVTRIKRCDSWGDYVEDKKTRIPNNTDKEIAEEMKYIKAYLKSMSEKLLQMAEEFEEFSNAINKKEI